MPRMRRANDESPGRRPLRLNLRLSEVEAAQLQAHAIQHRVTTPRYVLDRALSDNSSAPSITEQREIAQQLMRLTRQIAGIANNVNQLAHVANATQEIDPDTAETLAVARRVMDSLDSKVRELLK